MRVTWDCLTTTVQLQRYWKGRITVDEESEARRRKWSWPTWWYLAFAEGMKRIHKRISLKICGLLSTDTMIAQVWSRCANCKLATFGQHQNEKQKYFTMQINWTYNIASIYFNFFKSVMKPYKLFMLSNYKELWFLKFW